MPRRGVIESRLVLNRTDFTKGLKASVTEAQEAARQMRAAFSDPIKLPRVDMPQISAMPTATGLGRSRVDPVIAQQREQVRQYQGAQSALRTELERGVKTNRQYIASATALQREMLEFQKTLPMLSREWIALDRAIGTAQRGITTAAGGLSKLGLSQQVNLALTNQLQNQFASLGGVAGGVASVGISAMGGSLVGLSAGAALAGAGVVGLGVGTAALVARGVPQIKSFQKSINILAASGATDLETLDDRLAALQESAGRAGQAFSRSELAAALAETVKAGVSADDAFTILQSSLQLAAAEGTNLAESTVLVLKGIRQYQLGVGDATKVTDQLAQAGLLASGSATDISIGLSRVAGTGRAAGVEMSDLIGLIVELDNSGLEASDRGANALNSALTALAGLTPKAKDQLKEWNIEVNNTDGSARVAGDILADLGDKLRSAGVQYDESTDQLTGNGDALRGLANIMGTEGARAVLNLTGKWRDYAKEIENSQGVSRDYADQMSQGLEPAQKRLKTALDDLGKSAAEILAPGMEEAADATAKLARALERITNNPLSLGNIIDSAFGAGGEKRLGTVNRDIQRTRGQIEEIQALLNDPANTTPTTDNPAKGLFGLGQLDQGEIDRFIGDNTRQLNDLENKLKLLQTRRDNILSEYGLGSAGKANRSGRQQSLEPLPLLKVPASEEAVDEQAQAALEQAIRDSQDSATQAAIDALEEGSAKINATYHERIELEKRAFAQLTAGLDTSSSEYQQLQAASDIRIQALITQGNRELSDLTEQRLEAQRQVQQDLANLQAEIASAEVNAAANPIAAITAGRDEALRQNEVSRQRALAQITDDTEASRVLIIQINETYDAKELQLTEKAADDVTAVHQDRARRLKDINAQTREIQLQGQAAAQRDAGDEQAAIQTELQIRLNAITAALNQELSAEGLTAAQITAIRGRANAERIAARQQAGRDTAAAIKAEGEQAAAEAKAAQDELSKSANAYASAGSSSGGSIGGLLEQFKQEREARKTENAQVLADFKGTADERAQLIKTQGQLEARLTRQNGLQVNAESKKALTAYLVALKEHQNEVLRVRNEVRQSQIESARSLIDLQQGAGNIGAQAQTFNTLITLQREAAEAASELARKTRESGATTEEVLSAKNAEAEAYKSVQDSIQGQIDKLKSLRDEQVAVVEGGSQVLQYLRNQQELSGDNQFIGSSDVRDAISSQIDGYERLYQEAIRANAPIEERLELQERLKTLLAEAQTQGFDFKLDPSLLRLMESDVAAEVTSFPSKAAEAVKTVKTLDEQIAAAGTQLATVTEQLATLLGAAATDEGLRLKVTVDKKGLDQAKVALREAFGPETANKIIAQASSMGLDAGKAIVRTLRQGLQDRGGLLSEVANLVRDVDEFFPHSNAKRGALSELVQSGMSIPRTLALGVRRGTGDLVSAASVMSARAQPSFSIPTSKPLGYAGAAGAGGGNTYNYHTQIDGRRSDTTSIFGTNIKQTVELAWREVQLREG